MKKFAATALAASMFVLAACDNNEPTTPPSPNDPPTHETEPQPCGRDNEGNCKLP